MIKCFQKELLGSGFIVNGRRVPWEPLDGNQGVVRLDDASPEGKLFMDGLQKFVGKYGIVEITEQQYNEKKNKFPYNPAKLESKLRAERLQTFGPPPRKASAQGGAVAAGNPQTREQLMAVTAALLQAATPADAAISDVMSFKPATARLKQG